MTSHKDEAPGKKAATETSAPKAEEDAQKAGDEASKAEPSPELSARAQGAIALCRKGKFAEALPEFEAILTTYRKDTGKMPARLLSYYGVCVAEAKGKVSDGLECARISIARDRFHADHYANIARIYMLGRSRKKAVEALRSAASFDADNTLALQLWKEIGRRNRPVLSFLPRNHPVNVLLGRMKRKKTV